MNTYFMIEYNENKNFDDYHRRTFFVSHGLVIYLCENSFTAKYTFLIKQYFVSEAVSVLNATDPK